MNIVTFKVPHIGISKMAVLPPYQKESNSFYSNIINKKLQEMIIEGINDDDNSYMWSYKHKYPYDTEKVAWFYNQLKSNKNQSETRTHLSEASKQFGTRFILLGYALVSCE